MAETPIRHTVSRALTFLASAALLFALVPAASAGEPSEDEGVPCFQTELGVVGGRVCALHSGQTPEGFETNAVASASMHVASTGANALVGESTWSEEGQTGPYSSEGVGAGLATWGYVPVGDVYVPFYLTALVVQGSLDHEWTEGGMPFHSYRRVTQAWVETMGVGADVGQTELSGGGGDEWRLTGGRVYVFSPAAAYYYHPLMPFPVLVGARYTEAYAGQENAGAGCRMVVHAENGFVWLGETFPYFVHQDLGPCGMEAPDAPDVPTLPPPPPPPREIIDEVLP